MNATDEGEGKTRKRGKKPRIEMDQSKCWFCLASPSVEKHLIIAVGNTAYLALAKGMDIPIFYIDGVTTDS